MGHATTMLNLFLSKLLTAVMLVLSLKPTMPTEATTLKIFGMPRTVVNLVIRLRFQFIKILCIGWQMSSLSKSFSPLTVLILREGIILICIGISIEKKFFD